MKKPPSKVASVAAGGCLGTMSASGLFAIGMLLSLTGVGAIIGIPMMLCSMGVIGAFTIFGGTLKYGQCPKCHEPIPYTPFSKIATCRHCCARMDIADVIKTAPQATQAAQITIGGQTMPPPLPRP